MRDISELSGNTGQAKQTSEQSLNPKTRSANRPKQEHNTASSQDQERRPNSAPRRRTTTNPVRHNQNTTENNGEQRSALSGEGTSGIQTTRSQQYPNPAGNTHSASSYHGTRTSQASQGPSNAPNRPFGQGSAPRNPSYHQSPRRASSPYGGPATRSQGPGGLRPQGSGTPYSTSPRPSYNRSGPGPQSPSQAFPPVNRGVAAPVPLRGTERSERIERAERFDRGEKGERSDKSDRHEKGPSRANSIPRPTTSTIKRPTQRPATPVARPPQERRTPAVKEKPTGPITIPNQIIVKDLADLLQSSPIEIIKGLIKHGVFANINQVVDYEKASLVAKDLGYEPNPYVASTTQEDRPLSANEAMIAAREGSHTVTVPPVVTIMGHVDHGKTSLLDTIRKTKVAAGEAGGITQHIGAYQVDVDGKKITFLDTPGHEAFTAMRARGAQGANIAIIVIAADDGIMPQTKEAIDHAKAAKVPMIVALNKIDKLDANPDRVKQQLADIDVIIEEFGGETVCVPMSARKGIGIDELLEYILLVAEVQDIRANPNRLATGVIIEAKIEKSSGVTATVLVQQGTLKMGDNIVVGAIAGKVRAMFNDRGKRIQKAPPSTPVSILGLSEVPQAGDQLEAVADEKTAKQTALQEAEKRKNEDSPLGQVSLDTLYMQMQEGTVKELNVILKCDVQGSSEAIKNALSKLGENNLKVRLIHEGVGNISETDVHLASASEAIIIGFNVKADGAAQREAQREGVDIRYYDVIYKLLENIEAALTGMLEPTYREVIGGHAEVLQTFKAGRNIVIAGCRITDGKMSRSSQIRIRRKNEKVFEGKIASLRRGKDDVREVASGYECGITIEDFNNFETGDIIEAFSQERVQAGA
jgi:translation initiation factor IF-2